MKQKKPNPAVKVFELLKKNGMEPMCFNTEKSSVCKHCTFEECKVYKKNN